VAGKSKPPDTPSDSRFIKSGEEEVKNLSLYDAVSLYTDLKPSGPQFRGLSPFTCEKTPSFFVHPTKFGGCWKCFSTGIGGRGVDSFLDCVKKYGFDRRESASPVELDEENGKIGELPF
jgi:hypothetical protein